jgi:hypothetical protein
VSIATLPIFNNCLTILLQYREKTQYSTSFSPGEKARNSCHTDCREYSQQLFSLIKPLRKLTTVTNMLCSIKKRTFRTDYYFKKVINNNYRNGICIRHCSYLTSAFIFQKYYQPTKNCHKIYIILYSSGRYREWRANKVKHQIQNEVRTMYWLVHSKRHDNDFDVSFFCSQ